MKTLFEAPMQESVESRFTSLELERSPGGYAMRMARISGAMAGFTSEALQRTVDMGIFEPSARIERVERESV
jgi:hypothetical protein